MNFSTLLTSKTTPRIAGTNPTGIIHQEVWSLHLNNLDTARTVTSLARRFSVGQVKVQYTTDANGAPVTRFSVIR